VDLAAAAIGVIPIPPLPPPELLAEDLLPELTPLTTLAADETETAPAVVLDETLLPPPTLERLLDETPVAENPELPP
jgi:hypothetical protein